MEFFIKKDYAPLKIGRNCIICEQGFDLFSERDPRQICPSCCAALRDIIAERNKEKKDGQLS